MNSQQCGVHVAAMIRQMYCSLVLQSSIMRWKELWTNCRPDQTVSLIDSDDQEAISVDPLKLDQKNCLIDIHQNDLDFDKIDVPDKPEMNALVYVVGYVISKLPHEKCRRNFRSPSSGKHLDDECFTFTRLKKFWIRLISIFPMKWH